MITVTYTSIDRCRITRRCKTIKAARKFAHRYVGAHPEMGSYYAVSGDGVGKVTVNGVTLHELFPEKVADAGGFADPEKDYCSRM